MDATPTTGAKALVTLLGLLRMCLALGALVALVSLLSPETAGASELLDRNATNVTLKVNAKGEALVSYRVQGKTRRVLAWGAVNARPPSPMVKQVSFGLDYAGGWGKYRRPYWQTFKDGCRPYDGPEIAWLLLACKAPDGSYWALQRWQRMLPNLGIAPWLASQRVWELRLSHWVGPLPVLEGYLNWSYRRYRHFFGRYSYRGRPVYGFKATSTGVPLDSHGRNVYLDTLDSAYGPGWRRENSFLTHSGTGVFCYGFYERDPYAGYPQVGKRPEGHGTAYRATVIGPGVTPDVMWEGEDPGDYDPADPEKAELEQSMNALRASFADPTCRQN